MKRLACIDLYVLCEMHCEQRQHSSWLRLIFTTQDAQWFSDKKKGKGGRGPRVSELDQGEDAIFGALEEEGLPPEKSAEPTMMSLEAREMFLSGQGKAGLQMWKVEFCVPHVLSSCKRPRQNLGQDTGGGIQCTSRITVSGYDEPSMSLILIWQL